MNLSRHVVTEDLGRKCVVRRGSRDHSLSALAVGSPAVSAGGVLRDFNLVSSLRAGGDFSANVSPGSSPYCSPADDLTSQQHCMSHV